VGARVLILLICAASVGFAMYVGIGKPTHGEIQGGWEVFFLLVFPYLAVYTVIAILLVLGVEKAVRRRRFANRNAKPS
jgi:hypothetical protein